VQSKPGSEELCRVSRFALAAGENMAHAAGPRRAAIACMRARPRALSGQLGTGMLGSIATSGWVMKNTTRIPNP
jgi:hypothetical protein